jgi:hypothetical protein
MRSAHRSFDQTLAPRATQIQCVGAETQKACGRCAARSRRRGGLAGRIDGE